MTVFARAIPSNTESDTVHPIKMQLSVVLERVGLRSILKEAIAAGSASKEAEIKAKEDAEQIAIEQKAAKKERVVEAEALTKEEITKKKDFDVSMSIDTAEVPFQEVTDNYINKENVSEDSDGNYITNEATKDAPRKRKRMDSNKSLEKQHSSDDEESGSDSDSGSKSERPLGEHYKSDKKWRAYLEMLRDKQGESEKDYKKYEEEMILRWKWFNQQKADYSEPSQSQIQIWSPENERWTAWRS